MSTLSLFKGICPRMTSGTITGQPQLTTGWTSVYYTSAASFDDAIADFQAVNIAEMACYPAKVTCNAIRVSAVGDPRNVQIAPPGVNGGAGQDTINTIPADPNIALRIKCRTGTNLKSYKYLRGFGYVMFSVSIPSAFLPTPATDTNLGNLATAIKDHTVHIEKKQLGTPNYLGSPYTAVDFPVTGGTAQAASIRRSGRPFGLRHGRRQTG